uniref:Uncharacterized protein n=1 Tax=Lotus japonicus TaxID=34305 RepID=I3SMQ4_LOTJA|nr:unknown [Lotus japonicus]AFK41546.1 unknown [Lotus japonicus]
MLSWWIFLFDILQGFFITYNNIVSLWMILNIENSLWSCDQNVRPRGVNSGVCCP